jgi:hypothetical protein
MRKPKCRKNVRAGAGAERNIYGSATQLETRRRATTGDLERNILFLFRNDNSSFLQHEVKAYGTMRNAEHLSPKKI